MISIQNDPGHGDVKPGITFTADHTRTRQTLFHGRQSKTITGRGLLVSTRLVAETCGQQGDGRPVLC